MAQLGNKENSYLNGEWACHVRKRDGGKRVTSKRRRAYGKRVIDVELQEEEISPPGSVYPLHSYKVARKR